MSEYDDIRRQYRPNKVRWLLIAESPPPGPDFGGSRHFYRDTPPRPDDRVFNNTIKALYGDAEGQNDQELQEHKAEWLKQLQADGLYMIEALEESQAHQVTKKQRQERIAVALPRLIERVKQLATPETGLVLIKSNVFDVAAEPLQQAGFKVLNQKLVDYPGVYNQTAYRQKLAALLKADGWTN